MTSTVSSTQPPLTKGLNHLKLPSHNIKKTHDFYTKIMGFNPLPHYNHYTPEHKLFAVMVEHPSTKLIIEIRYMPAQATAQKGWDPVTWGGGNRQDLEDWTKWLDTNDVKHSEILVGIKGWVMGFEDPDGKIVRLYVEDEEHEWTDHPSQDEYWLGTVVADPEA
jgi:catechol 2,3-dioxygenase-like lactoylglutathione lyase family enzyme